MERSKPSLVPEWFKGTGGGGGALHHSQPPIHQDESGGGSFLSRQRSKPHGASAGTNDSDYNSPRYAVAPDRTFYSTARRGPSNNRTRARERPLFPRESYSPAYSSFGRNPTYCGYKGSLDREREGPRNRERDSAWERDRERDRALRFGGGDGRDRDRDRARPEAAKFRRSSSGAAGRYKSEDPLRRSQSMGAGRILELGDKTATTDVGTLPTVPPANIGALTSSMQKAAFERNLPSLWAQERQGALHSGFQNVSLLSPRPSWQRSSRRPEGVRSSTSGAGLTSVGSASASAAAPVNVGVNVGGSGIGGEGWSSALAEVPSALTGTSSTINGVISGVTSVPTATSGASGLSAIAARSLIVPKMSEALAEHPPQVCTPPQFSLGSQRIEEAFLKQSRQLISMKQSLPKSMGPRHKIKPKVVRAVDAMAPQPVKLSQPLASQLVSSPYRPPASQRPEPLKAPQGKLVLQKTSKEAVAAALSQSNSLKGDGGGLTSVRTSASALLGMGATNSSTNVPAGSILAPPPWKQKQLLDRRAVPIPPIQMGSEGRSGPLSKESGSSSEDKRPPIPAQDRSDLFNGLRKKAVGIGISPGSIEKTVTGKNDVVNEKRVEADEESVPFSGDVPQMKAYKAKENGTAVNSISKNIISFSNVYVLNDGKGAAPSNVAFTEGAEGNSEQSVTAPSSAVSSTICGIATEEEEAAFLRSLGWEESAEESGEGLTEEEINSFYQERHRSISISPWMPNARNHQLRDAQVDQHMGSIGSISSGMSSSDSESDDDLRVRRRS